MHITLKAGERIFLNGAVFRADRKVSIELMNDATFLLEAHVMQPDRATTPLRQLYFVVQSMLISPQDTSAAMVVFRTSMERMRAAYDDKVVLRAIDRVDTFVAGKRFFEALKELRGVFARDDALMARPQRALPLAC